jgi:hypothetical protein
VPPVSLRRSLPAFRAPEFRAQCDDVEFEAASDPLLEERPRQASARRRHERPEVPDDEELLLDR